MGEGGLRSGPIFYLFSDVNFGCQNWPNLVQFLVIFCFNFGLFFSLDLGVIWVSFGIFLGLHEGFLVGLWRQKPLNFWGVLWFLEM